MAGRKLVPVKGKAKGAVQAKKPDRRPGVPRGVLSTGDRRYARLLADPCNAPYTMGMVADGFGTSAQRFVGDYVIATGANETSINLCVVPSQMTIYNANSIGDNTNLTWTSGYTFPGAAVLATAGRTRCIAACVQVSWYGSEQTRHGCLAMGNAPRLAAANANTTPGELRSSMPYVARLPSDTVGIKWRPNENDLSFSTAGADNALASALYVQVSNLGFNTSIRFRVVVVMEWEAHASLGNGTPIQQYPPKDQGDGDRFIRAMQWLDKTGHWLLDNGAAFGHAASAALQLLAA